MEKLVALCKQRGFIFPGSEIYGGLANTWDYGPLGAELKDNIKKAWRKKFITESDLNVGLDSGILLNPRVWEASGHLSNFADPLMDCKECKERFRADKLIEDYALQNNLEISVDGWSNQQLKLYIDEKNIPCPSCGKHNFTDIRQFNLMFKTFSGPVEDAKSAVYLRPETAQGIFINFKNVLRTSRKKIPFGIGQVGKTFRNEITPEKFIFRTREFEQLELEFFCKPGTDLEWFNYYRKFCMDFLLSLNIKPDNLRYRDHAKEELSHYSNATTDIEYKFPFGWGELWGIADRTDYDLSRHMEYSGEDMNYFDSETGEKYVPYCVEPSLGADRLLLVLLCDAYGEETLDDGETRSVLRFHPAIAPIKAAVLPLSKKLGDGARKIYLDLIKTFPCLYDEAQSIGRRYRRMDEIGVPFCATYDFDSAADQKVTVRDRDSMTQVRIPIDSLENYIAEKIKF